MGLTPSATKSAILSAYIPAGTTINAYLTTAAVVDANSTVAALTQPSGGNYTLQALTSIAPTVSGTTAIVTTSAGPVWNNLYTTAATPIVGVAFAKQIGGSPATTDPIVGYSTLSAQTTVANCSLTNNSEIVTTTGTFAAYAKGQLITGTGIPLGTTIAEITSTTQLILSQPATATNTGITLTGYTPSPYTPPTATNTTPLNVPMPATGLLSFL